METWYYWADNQEFGPVTKLELYKLFKTNVIAGYSFVRPQDSDAWLSYKELKIRRSDFTWEELNGEQLNEEELNKTAEFATEAEGISDTNPNPDKDTDSVWNDVSPHPWRRYFARWIDISIYGNLIFYPFISPYTPEQLTNLLQLLTLTQLLAILCLAPMTLLVLVVFLNTALSGVTGTTIGKYLLGIKILNKNHSTLSIPQTLKREVLVLIKGFALGLPVLSIITQMYGYFDLAMDKMTSWDKSMDTVILHRENNGFQYLICILSISLYLYFA
ncbi:RDD family protein [Kiloniella majae]|uniref:RDD family protein n=1 Tax=Kiloniella majae TaxID=1938558 RepID=UPI000A278600|nr:RDD family protein [Kiloniella majae]